MKSLQILGPGMSAKMWDVTVEHALTCVIDKRVYLYYSPGTQHIKCVAFNIAGEILGLLTENQYVRADKLEEDEKAMLLTFNCIFAFHPTLSYVSLSNIYNLLRTLIASLKPRNLRSLLFRTGEG